ncbi:diguanylate phosphodiesterase [Burkholderia pseudomallei]|nr:diguanylate phosphodiesterase [Burkholderia pseudomallei]ARL65351.1 diguanylate phosphodiesterase [Burkholderia pseudomallei]
MASEAARAVAGRSAREARQAARDRRAPRSSPALSGERAPG